MFDFKEFRSLSKPFISYKKQTITYAEFFNSIDEIIKKFDSFKKIDDFIVLSTDNPIEFYSLLFALWSCEKKVVFPNKDYLDGNHKGFEFVKFIYIDGEIITNHSYKFCKLNNSIDTVVFSSGSTGTPKGIAHNKRSFFLNADSVSKVIEFDNIVTVTMLKPYLVSAFSHFLVHLLKKSHLIFLEIENIVVIEELSLKYDNLSFVGSPMQISSMQVYIKNKYPDFFFTSGDVFYSGTLSKIIKRFPNTIFYNVYGLAELAGRLFINKIDNNTQFKNFRILGTNINNTEVQIENDEVLVKSDFLFYGYIIDNKFNQRKGNYFFTNDKVIKVNNNYEFYGRKNDEIKVLGNKVSLKYLEQKISEVLSNTYVPIIVNEVHDFFGNLIVLVVYTKEEKLLSREDILSLLNKKLLNYEIPHKIYWIDNIPYTQTMKIDRKVIVEKLKNLKEVK